MKAEVYNHLKQQRGLPSLTALICYILLEIIMNPVFLLMAIASLVFAINSPFWWLNVIALWCSWEYLKMSAEI